MSNLEVIKKINEAIRALYIVDDNGYCRPIVCVICDRFVVGAEMDIIELSNIVQHKQLFIPNQNFNLTPSLQNQYTIEISEETGILEGLTEENRQSLFECLLSPRSKYLKCNNERKLSGYPICKKCKNFIRVNRLPRYCISNNYAFGKTPKCLSELTAIELAMITPVKTFGYCFSYTGGKLKQIKGSLSYYKISSETIVDTAVNLERIGLNNHVVLIIYGAVTVEQLNVIEKKYEVRTSRINRAIRWLVKNNIQWTCYKDKVDELTQSIQDPFRINNSRVESTINDVEIDTRVESTESFQVYYPDGTVTTVTGGQQNMEEFQSVVQEASEQGYNIECKVKVITKSVRDYEDNNLVNACLLQFPYGRGGINESRYNSKGELSTVVDIMEYTKYVSLVSLPQMQAELFCLQLFNMQMKFVMVLFAGYKLRNTLCASLLANKITPSEVYNAIGHNRRGSHYENRTENGGQTLLHAVDTICKHIPHSNEAAVKARRGMETMQHHFGCPTFFLTITPDDDNHIIVQIYSDEILSSINATDKMTDDEVFALSNKKSGLRIKNPGVCALFFELMIDIIFKDVIGWDKENSQSYTTVGGIFGKVDALTMSIEEQGRRTLHAHILLWVPKLNAQRTSLYSNIRRRRRMAYNKIIKKIDELCSTKFIFNGNETHRREEALNTAFPHTCIETMQNGISYPMVSSDQQLRNLRCKRPHNDIAYKCNRMCQTEWTSKQLVTSYLKNYIKVPNISNDYSSNVRRLKNKTTEFQLAAPANIIAPEWMVDAAYNHHVHTNTCFKNKGNKQNDTNKCDECRLRCPQAKKRKTMFIETQTIKQPWYSWNGLNHPRSVLELNLKRSEYDIFQNVCCPQIAYSKFTCNNNLAFLLPGPIAQYCTSYTMKNTQPDEVREYDLVQNACEKILSKSLDTDTPRSVAMRRLLSTTFKHQSNNIVGAAMASYLTRNKSRFYFSHEMVWCPLRDIENILDGEEVSTELSIVGTDAYFKCEALHYLCRPIELENVSVFNFFYNYIICPNVGNVYQFQNSGILKHPSYCDRTKIYRQAIKKRKHPKLPKIYQCDFPDTAMFEGNILNTQTIINDYMEKYSWKVLLLFLPYRKKEDILKHEYYTETLRYAYNEKLIDKSAFVFLQNLQDCKANNLRNVSYTDDLQRKTQTPSSSTENSFSDHDIDEDDDISTSMQLNDLADLSYDMDQYIVDPTDITNQTYDTIPSTFSCIDLRNKGCEKCGFEKLPIMKNIIFPINRNFVISNRINIDNIQPATQYIDRENPDSERLVYILFRYNEQITKSFTEITGQQENVIVYQPNGSAKSIVDWSRKSKLDKSQQRAFEIITASLVLSYYDSALDISSNAHNLFIEHKTNLQLLVNNKISENNQLICFLHGPGGSGKSALIDLVSLYAKDFCSYLWSGFQSSERVIVVTAMTGVAATILQGETTHAALYLNQKKGISPEQIDHWKKTKMVIIDEVSFADEKDIVKMHKHLSTLKQKPELKYGGLNIIFSGDCRQLEPVGRSKKPLYESNVTQFKDWVNCYFPLDGIHRFKDDPDWGNLLSRMRNGNATITDIETINTQIEKNVSIPPSIKYACYFNKDKDAINTGIFVTKITDAYETYGTTANFMLIFADKIEMKNISNVYKQFSNTHILYESYSESNLKVPNRSGKMDLVLKLYPGCRVMLPENVNVAFGQANGTQATVQQIVLKQNVQPKRVLLGGLIPVAAVFASQVNYIQLRHSNTRIAQPLFKVESKSHRFKLKLPSMHILLGINTTFDADMKANQFPILHNDASTGHKLQGSGVENLFVHKWSNVRNWNYVMLSRVRKMSGLFARFPLPTDMKLYVLHPAYKNMIQKFTTITPVQLTEEEYDNITN
jgi:Helitron helicase-like domain at N-terminus/PIF1-like helicase